MIHDQYETDSKHDFGVLRSATFAELLSQEAEIVRRIALIPNGGWLLALDPQRLFRDLGVQPSAVAVEEWKARYPDFFKRIGNEHAYDAMARSRANDGITIVVDGLFRRERA